MDASLSPDQLTLLRQLARPAPVLLVLAALGRPAGAKEIAAILDLNEHTVSNYLKELSAMNLVARLSYRQGYILIGLPQLLLGDPAVVQALLEAGIGEPKRSKIASLPHVTPDYVRLWEAYLVDVKGEKYTPGLLIYVLEKGHPIPKTNAFGHLKSCQCADCQRLGYLVCPYCHQYPCDCDLEEEEDDLAG